MHVAPPPMDQLPRGAATEARDVPMLEPSVKVRSVPSDIRLGFVKKVYGITATMLLLSFAVASVFVFDRDRAADVFSAHPWIFIGVSLFLLAHHIVNLVILGESCFGGGRCTAAYLRMFNTVPWNYCFCMTYAVSFGVVLGLICAEYEAQSVSLVFAFAAVLVAALTLYAVYSKTDFTGYGMYNFAAFIGLFLLGLVVACLPHESIIDTAFAAFGSVVLSFSIIYHTQLILGTASHDFGNSAARRIEFTIDMYCFAAYQLYLDFVNLFLNLLRLLGKRRS